MKNKMYTGVNSDLKDPQIDKIMITSKINMKDQTNSLP